MQWHFDTMVDRTGTGNMKGNFALHTTSDQAPLILAGAEMDFPTAPVIRDALSHFAQKGIYGFTLPDDPYLTKIVRWMQDVRQMDLQKEDIVPTLGTIFALSTAVRCYTKVHDKICILMPSYYRHDRVAVRNDREVVTCPLKCVQNQYEIDFPSLQAILSDPKCSMLVLCNPHNPTGTVFDADTLRELATLAEQTNTLIFSDEIFAEHTMTGFETIPMTNLCPDHAIVCTSLGKAFNFTGVNHAHVIIRNEELRARYLEQRNRDHFGSLDPFFYQAVMAGYSEEGWKWIESVRDHVAENAQLLATSLRENCAGYVMTPLQGGFTAWIHATGDLPGGEALAALLEHRAAVLVDPGDEYGEGGEKCIRMNLATPRENIRIFVDRLTHAIGA